MIYDDFIGKGLSSGVFDNLSGGMKVASGLDEINDSIRLILSTPIGSRYFLPEFGSRLYELVFEPNNYILEDLLKIYINDALNKWEKRIKVTNISVCIIQEGNEVPVTISYRVLNSNIEGSYVYPFTRELYSIGGSGEHE